MVLAGEVTALAGENKTRAIKVALQERQQRLAVRVVAHDRHGDLLRFLREEVWPRAPRRMLGKRTTRKELDAILGYGPKGV